MHQQSIVELVARNRLPAVYPAREFVQAGGLIAYAVNYPDLYLRLASLIDKIFRGAKPGELPVEQPTKFELIINSKTAKTLGLTIPPTLLVDEVIPWDGERFSCCWPPARRVRSGPPRSSRCSRA